MKFRLSFGSKAEKVLIPSSPVKEKPAIVNGSNRVSDSGSKEEAFFDSQPWLDSDCDDDFVSVNGEFTPSRGSTPVHHKFSTGAPQVKKPSQTEGQDPEPSPTNSKKKLSDLFKESLRADPEVIDPTPFINQNGTNGKSGSDPSTLDTPYVSGATSLCNSERTPNRDLKYQKEKTGRSAQCCMPRLLSSRSLRERKKKMSSPVASVG